MILDKEVETTWVGGTKKYYINLGYNFTKIGSKFNVLVDHLKPKSNLLVSVKCDGCNRVLNIPYSEYTNRNKNGEYFCNSCGIRNYNRENIYTFKQYCIDNNKIDILNRWDDKLNRVSPDCVGCNTTNKHYFICENGLHNSESKNINNSIKFNSFGCSECKKINRSNRKTTIWNLSGRKYNMLYVHSYNGQVTKMKNDLRMSTHHWNCICDCGNEVVKSEAYLTNKNSIKSCGCYYEKSLITIDLTGNKFGKLKVVGFDENRSRESKDNKTYLKYWFCECECGNIKSVNQMNLTQGKTKSCGCEFYRKCIDMSGKVYGRLTVLERDYSKNTEKVMWKCLCECGNISIVESNCLKRGDTISCGCYHSERISGSNNHNWKNGITETHIYFRRCLVPWNKYILSLYNNECIMSGTNYNLDVHHTYSFRKLLEESFNEANLKVQDKISKYTDSELLLLKNILLKKHYELNCGLPMTKFHHDMFHKAYGYIDTDFDQFLMYLYDKSDCPELINNKIQEILNKQKSTA